MSKHSDNFLFPYFFSLATLHPIFSYTSKCFCFTSLHPFLTHCIYLYQSMIYGRQNDDPTIFFLLLGIAVAHLKKYEELEQAVYPVKA